MLLRLNALAVAALLVDTPVSPDTGDIGANAELLAQIAHLPSFQLLGPT